MPGHTHLTLTSNIYYFEETFDNYQQAKINFYLLHFPWDIAKILQLVVSGTLGMAGYAHPKLYYLLKENL